MNFMNMFRLQKARGVGQKYYKPKLKVKDY